MGGRGCRDGGDGRREKGWEQSQWGGGKQQEGPGRGAGTKERADTRGRRHKGAGSRGANGGGGGRWQGTRCGGSKGMCQAA